MFSITVLRRLLLLALAAGLLAPGAARAAVTVAEGAPQLGHVHLVASSDPVAHDLSVVEVTDGASTAVPASATADGIEASTPWNCTRARTFVAVHGDERSEPLTVAAPDCAERLKLIAFRSVGLGDNLKITVQDQWHMGDLEGDVCAERPDGARRCRHIAFPTYQWIANAVFPADRPGTWTVTLSSPHQTVAKPVVVVRRHYPRGLPTVLTTGDSMMLSTTTALRDLLAGVARRVRDIYVGSGLSRPFVVDWSKLPAQQNHAYHPDAVVVSLGMADGRDLPTRDGSVACCGPDYVAAYAARARRLMKAWSHDGRTAVVWTNEPYTSDPRHDVYTRMVNAALPIAARGLERVEVLDFAEFFTPGETYRETMLHHGHDVRIRAADGLHMSLAGGRIAAHLVRRALHRLGVIGRPAAR